MSGNTMNSPTGDGIDLAKIAKADDKPKLSFEEHQVIIARNKVKLPANALLFAAPLAETKTKGGIWKPTETTTNDEKNAAFMEWQKILLSTHPDIKVGDSVIFRQSMFQGARVVVEGRLYISAEYHMVAAISEGGIAEGGLSAEVAAKLEIVN